MHVIGMEQADNQEFTDLNNFGKTGGYSIFCCCFGENGCVSHAPHCFDTGLKDISRMQDDILKLAYEVSQMTREKIHLIASVMNEAKFLAINTRIEAARVGQAGAAFGLLADEMGRISTRIVGIASELRSATDSSTERLLQAGNDLLLRGKGERMTDLALNVVDLIDRNLYERSCDVRWWATDSAVVQALESATPQAYQYAAERLATILKSYTVYLDLFIVDPRGKVVACGRPQTHRSLEGSDMSGEAWFAKAMRTQSGEEYAVADVNRVQALNNEQAAIYSTAIRAGGDARGQVLGVLGIAFDWAPQAEAIVNGVRLSDVERGQTRVMLVDAHKRIIASSNGSGVSGDYYKFTPQAERGYYVSGDKLIAYAHTPGYETYKGLGWYGVLETSL